MDRRKSNEGNDGFVGNTRPDNPSIVDLLGPWPGCLLIIVLLMLPWEIAKRRRVTA